MKKSRRNATPISRTAKVRPRFTGAPTFFRLPYAEELAGIDIGIIGVPFDGGVTNRPGARHARAKCATSRACCARINAVTGVAPFAGRRVADLGDCWIEQPYVLDGALGEIARFFESVKAAG